MMQWELFQEFPQWKRHLNKCSSSLFWSNKRKSVSLKGSAIGKSTNGRPKAEDAISSLRGRGYYQCESCDQYVYEDSFMQCGDCKKYHCEEGCGEIVSCQVCGDEFGRRCLLEDDETCGKCKHEQEKSNKTKRDSL